jgi:hypothetical protein
MHLLPALCLILALLGTRPAFAHGGGLNADGCHTNRKTGEYHCHRSPGAKRAAGRTTLAPSPQPLAPAGRSFRNCAEARAAGAAPVRRGDAGYAPHLDRDNDGVGCE